MESHQQWQEKPVLLVVGELVPKSDLTSVFKSNFNYLKTLAGLGFEPRFLSADFQRVEPYSTELNQLGIETLDGEWYRENWEYWLEENGQSIDFVLFQGSGPVDDFLPAFKRFSRAVVIYQCHGRLTANEKASPEAVDLPRTNRDAAFSQCDFVLVSSESEQEIIETEFPRKKALVDPVFETLRGINKRVVDGGSRDASIRGQVCCATGCPKNERGSGRVQKGS